MRKNKELLLLMTIATLAIVMIGCNKNNSEQNLNNNLENQQSEQTQNNNTNQEEKFIEKTIKIEGNKKVENVEISNIQIKLVSRNKCEVTANVKNLSDEYINPTNTEIRVVNKDGETEEIFGGIITELIGKEENTFATYVLADITDAHDLEFSKIEN